MDIETRIESLEDDIRRQKDDLIRQEKKLLFHKRLWMGAACLLAGALVLGATKPVPKVIVAEKFVLRDAKGTEKGLWQVTSVGSEFMMAEGENRKLFLVINKKRTGMAIFDKQGLVRLQADSHYEEPGKGNEKPGLLLFDKNGRIQVGLVALDRSTPSLGFSDSSGTVRAYMGMREGKPTITMLDKRGIPRAAIFQSEDDEPKIRLLNQYGIVFWRSPLQPEERK
jgi:hypothetical protein